MACGSNTIETLCTVVAVVSGSYLGWRAFVGLLRVRWARHAYPAIEPGTARDSARADRARGALLGLAAGDALGLPAESLAPWLIRLRYPGGPRHRHGIVRFYRRAGDVSDDTQLSLCVARSITPEGEYLHPRFLDELRFWGGYRIGAGRACSRAARRLRTLDREGALRWPDAGDRQSQGNGAAMRVAPLVLSHARDADTAALVADVRQNAAATHAQEVAITAAVAVALVLHAALTRPAGALTSELVLDLARQAGFPTERLEAALVAADPATCLRLAGTSGHALQSVSAALTVLAHDTSATPHRLLAAIFFAGGDVDSVASIVGAGLGAQLGESGLPAEWLGKLQHADVLAAQAERLIDPQPKEKGRGEVVEVEGNVATREVDAIVDAWNRNVIPAWLLLPQGVSLAIKKAGGRPAMRAVARRAPLPLGAATETRAGELAARWVIHVAGINLAWRGSVASVRYATSSALELARCLGARSVALPVIGAGSGGFAPGRAKEIVLAELAQHAEHFDHLELVTPPR